MPFWCAGNNSEELSEDGVDKLQKASEFKSDYLTEKCALNCWLIKSHVKHDEWCMLTSNLPVLFNNNVTLNLQAKYVWHKIWNTISLFKFPQYLGPHAAAQSVTALNWPCHYLSIQLVFMYFETTGSYDCHFHLRIGSDTFITSFFAF